MKKHCGAMPMPMKHEANPYYSNESHQSIGYQGNDKGHANREREADKNWSDEKTLNTGLVDREKL